MGMAAFAGCSGSDDDGSSRSVGATCASTCEKAVDLACPNEVFTDQADCVAQCEAQTAECSDPAIVSAYLDCIQTTILECGATTGASSSPECVQQGLALFACTQNVDTDAGADGDTDDDADTGFDGDFPPMPSASVGQFVANIERAGESYAFDCTAATAPTFSLGAQTLTASGETFHVVKAECLTTADKNDPDAKRAFFVLTIPSLDVGSYAIQTEEPAAVNEEFQLSWREGGEGWSFHGNMHVIQHYEGTVTVVENAGSGGTMRVRLQASWTQGQVFEDGIPSGQPDSTPGAISAEWAFTQN